MAKSTISGLTVTIGADTKSFSAAIKELNKEARELSADLKTASEALKLDSTSIEKYADKLKVLEQQFKNASTKVDVIKQAIASLNKQYEEGKVSPEDYAKTLKNLEKQLESATREQDLAARKVDLFKKEINETRPEVGKWVTEEERAEQTAKKLWEETEKDAKATNKYGYELKSTKAELVSYSEETKDAKESTIGLGEAINTKLIGGVIQKGFQTLVNLAKSLARHLAEAAKEFVKFSGQAIEMAASYEDALGYADTIFGKTVSSQAKKWVEENTNALRIYKGDLLENLNTFGQLFQTMGLQSEESFGMATNILSLAADLRAATGKDTGDILQSLTAGFTNTTRALRQFGVRISEAEIKAYALDNGIVKVTLDQTKLADKTLKVREASKKAEDALDKYGEESIEYERALVNVNKAEDDLNKFLNGKVESLTAAERSTAIYKMMLEQLAPVIGQNERESGLFNSQLNEAKTRLKNLKETIGEQLLPVATELLSKFNAFLDTEEGKELINTIIQAFSDLATEIEKIVENGDLTEMVDHLIDSAPELVKQLGDIITNVINLVPQLSQIADDMLDILDAVNKFSLTNAWLNAEEKVEKFAKTYNVSIEEMELMISEFARRNDLDLVDVYNKWETYEPMVADYIDKIPEHTGNMANDIRLHLENSKNDIMDFAENQIPSIDTSGWQRFWHGLKDAVQNLWDFLTTFFSSEAWEKATTASDGSKWDFGSNFANFGAPHAEGGPVKKDRMYRVNDDAGHRIEWFIPGQDGYILNGNQVDRITNNNNSRNFSGGINIYVNSYGTNVAEVADELGEAFYNRVRMTGAMI